MTNTARIVGTYIDRVRECGTESDVVDYIGQRNAEAHTIYGIYGEMCDTAADVGIDVTDCIADELHEAIDTLPEALR